MNPDRAAELLQIPERGLELLQRFEEDEQIRKAIQAVQAGFSPADVASMYDLPFEGTGGESDETEATEGSIFIYECQSPRCRQKGRVATSSVSPEQALEDEASAALITCAFCRQKMVCVKSVEHEWELGNLKRTRLPTANIHDSMHGVDRTGLGSRTGIGISEEDYDD